MISLGKFEANSRSDDENSIETLSAIFHSRGCFLDICDFHLNFLLQQQWSTRFCFYELHQTFFICARLACWRSCFERINQSMECNGECDWIDKNGEVFVWPLVKLDASEFGNLWNWNPAFIWFKNNLYSSLVSNFIFNKYFCFKNTWNVFKKFDIYAKII